MTVETFGNGGVVITGNSIESYRLISIQKALKLEILSGMKFSNRVNVAQQARAVLESAGVKAPRNKDKLLTVYVRHLQTLGIKCGPY